MSDIPTLTHHTHAMDIRLRAVEDKLIKLPELYSMYENTLRHNQALSERIRGYEDIQKRFTEIERFIKTLIDYFDPTPKMKSEINKLKHKLKDKDEEIAKIKSLMKEVLK